MQDNPQIVENRKEQRVGEAQEVVDQLLMEDKLPFPVIVGSVLEQVESQYRVHFYDSRMHSLEFSCEEVLSFRKTFRAALLERVSSMSGPLANWPASED